LTITTIDGATVEIIRSYFGSAADQMKATLIRTAFNPVVYEVLDFGISIYDRHLDLIAEAPGVTLFLGENDYSIRKGVEYVGVDNLEPGDVVMMNYPYWSAAHALDMTLFAPVFVEGDARPSAYLCVRAHWLDLGAKDSGYVLDSTDVHQEGVLFPGTKVIKRGEPDHEILELIRFNSRMPDLVLGDFNAQVAALRTGQRRVVEIYEKFGRDSVEAAIQRVLSHGEDQTRTALTALPHGTWTAVDYMDDAGIGDEPVRMQVTVTVSADGFEVDFAGSAGAVEGPVNMPFGTTLAMCKVAMKALTTPHAPANAGQLRPLVVKAEPGTLFHAVYPAPTFTLWTAFVALELIYKALSQGMPDRVAASSGGDMPGLMMVGVHPDTGKLFAVSNNEGVGWGATPTHDGLNASMHLAASIVRNIPIEVLETKTTMLFERLELRTDSGGAGRFRGGVGIERHIRFLHEGEFLSVVKKTKVRPWAVAGGHEPEPNTFILFPGTERERRVSTRRTAVRAGDRVIVRTAGGGGYGNARERDPQAVRRDVLDGYVSAQAAREIYGQEVVEDRGDGPSTAPAQTAAPTP
jgi:N-methylhydantoinase B